MYVVVRYTSAKSAKESTFQQFAYASLWSQSPRNPKKISVWGNSPGMDSPVYSIATDLPLLIAVATSIVLSFTPMSISWTPGGRRSSAFDWFVVWTIRGHVTCPASHHFPIIPAQQQEKNYNAPTQSSTDDRHWPRLSRTNRSTRKFSTG